MFSSRRTTSLLINRSEYEEEMMSLSSRPDLRRVKIATFGLQTGVSSHGMTYPNNWTFNYLKHLSARIKVVATDVLVGYNNDTILSILTNTATVFPAISWYAHPETHFKCAIYTFKDGKDIAVFGGRNLSSSTWADVSIRSSDAVVSRQLLNLFDSLVREARLVRPLLGGKTDFKVRG